MVLNTVFIPECHINTIQDDITAKTVPIWLHHTCIPLLLNRRYNTPNGLRYGRYYIYDHRHPIDVAGIGGVEPVNQELHSTIWVFCYFAFKFLRDCSRDFQHLKTDSYGFGYTVVYIELEIMTFISKYHHSLGVCIPPPPLIRFPFQKKKALEAPLKGLSMRF